MRSRATISLRKFHTTFTRAGFRRSVWAHILLDRRAVESRLAKMRQPVLVLRAPEGLTGKGDEVVPDEFRDAILKLVPQARFVDIPRTNHHTILCSLAGARAVAREINRFAV